jgi:hypothetical protein
MLRRTALLGLAGLGLRGQSPGPGFICPMDKDVKSATVGKCPRCGMKLVANLPDPIEYLLDLRATRGESALLEFRVRHPKTGQTVREFEVMHERLMHAFVISADLLDFAHDHPSLRPDGSFALAVKFARAVPYRVVADFYPKGGTPQFLAKTVFPANAPLVAPPHLDPDLEPKSAANLSVELVTEPAQPIAGQETLLFFRVTPYSGLQPYLAAWGHLLAASDDLVDVMHDHPLYVDGVPPPDLRTESPKQIQFNLIFPRERIYRVWAQFQREGIVNTVAFTIPVKALR